MAFAALCTATGLKSQAQLFDITGAKGRRPHDRDHILQLLVELKVPQLVIDTLMERTTPNTSACPSLHCNGGGEWCREIVEQRASPAVASACLQLAAASFTQNCDACINCLCRCGQHAAGAGNHEGA